MPTYLANAFSPSMLALLPLDVEFSPVNEHEFCKAVNGNPVNAVGHQSTVDLINQLCGSSLKANRINITVDIGDEIYIIVLTTRLEEGKVLSKEEIMKMYQEGKVKFIKVKIYGAVLEQLTSCENICNEAEYDTLAHKAKRG
jgi:hypothetical protein